MVNFIQNIFRYMSIEYTVNFDRKHSVFNYALLTSFLHF